MLKVKQYPPDREDIGSGWLVIEYCYIVEDHSKKNVVLLESEDSLNNMNLPILPYLTAFEDL